MTDTGQVHGFIPIETQIFDGTEKTILTPDGELAITAVSLPTSGDDGSGMRVLQYMAIVYTSAQAASRPWLGLTNFVNNESSGYYSQWFMTTSGMFSHFGLGTLLTALTVGTGDPVVETAAPSPSLKTFNWAATIPKDALTVNFFDVNWVKLLQSSLPQSEEVWGIKTISGPVGGEFKATIVGQPIATTFGLLFPTLRFIKLKPIEAQNYDFQFEAQTSNSTYLINFTIKVQ